MRTVNCVSQLLIALAVGSTLLACGAGPEPRPNVGDAGASSGGSSGAAGRDGSAGASGAGTGGTSGGAGGSGGSGASGGSGGSGGGGAGSSGGAGGSGGVGTGGAASSGGAGGLAGSGGSSGASGGGSSGAAGSMATDAGSDAKRDAAGVVDGGSTPRDASADNGAPVMDAGSDRDSAGTFDAPRDVAQPLETGPRDAGVPGRAYYLSDLPWVGTPVNGWGPVERDKSCNEQGVDGNPLTIHGVTYAKGLGAHAASSIRYNLAGRCQTFTAMVGLDDEQICGSVRFAVNVDGVSEYTGPDITHLPTGSVPPNPPAIAVSIDVTGATTLELVIDPLGLNRCDHADWADAKVICTSAP